MQEDITEPFTFISYAHADRRFVDSLVVELGNAGVVAWYDQSLTPGHSWTEEIENRLRSANGLIVVLSPDSSSSEYVRKEVQYAKEAVGLSTIIPLYLRDCHIPLMLSGVQWVDARNKQADSPEIVLKLKSALGLEKSAVGIETVGIEAVLAKGPPTSSAVLTPPEPVHLPRFHYGGVVPPEFFIGRERELADAEALVREHHNFLLVGVRRAGKTSFCKKLVHQIMGQPANHVLASVLNMESFSDLTIDTFLSHTIVNMIGEICRQVFHCKSTDLSTPDTSQLRSDLQQDPTFMELRNVNREVIELTYQRHEVSPSPLLPQTFVGLTQDLLEIIRAKGWGNYAIFYDEANHLTKDLSIGILTSHAEALSAAHLTSVYAASPEMGDSFRPLHQSFGHQVHLGPFRKQDDMLCLLARYYHGDSQSTSDLPITPEALALVWQYSRGRPFHLQFLFGYSFQCARREQMPEVNKMHVIQALDELVVERPEYFADTAS